MFEQKDTEYKAHCTYFVKPSYEQEVESLLERYWPRLKEFNLVTDEKPIVFRGDNSSGRFYLEVII